MMKTLVLLSGGADTCALVSELHAEGDDLFGITFDYGQTNRKEIAAAKSFANLIGFQHNHAVVDISAVANLLGGSLVGDGEIGESQDNKANVVPNRNAIFLAIAFGWADQIGADRVAYGAHGANQLNMRDAGPEFVDAFRAAMTCSLNLPLEGLKEGAAPDLYAPYVYLERTEIIERGEAVAAPWQVSWTCYRNGEIHCGRCPACVDRVVAFYLAGYEDPVEYEDTTYFWRELPRDEEGTPPEFTS